MDKKPEQSQTPDAASDAARVVRGSTLLPPGGGETGALIRSLDWSRTRLGPVERWPRSLLAALSILVESHIPNWLWWGPELIQFYNDAALPIMGRAKHPTGMGQPIRDGWAEAFYVVEPILLAALEQGRPSFVKDGFLPLNRYGSLEECYFDYAYTPIRDDDGQPGGVFCTVIEKTDHILAERRLRTLRDASTNASAQRRVEDAGREAARVLAGNPHDVPFALLYLVDEDRKSATLAGAAGLTAGSAEAPERVELGSAGDAHIWPVAEVLRSRTARLVEHLDARGLALPGGPWPQPLTSALVLPILESGHQQLAAVLVAGLSPMRPMDEKYRSFLELVAGQIESALATARAYEVERLRAESLAELDRAKTAFFSNVSHELRTPLTLILGPVEDALAQSSHVLQGEALRTVHRSAQRLLRLVNSLLDFSRIEAGRLQAQIEPTDLAALTTDLASSFRSLVEREGLTFVVDCPPLPELVHVDPTMWEKIVFNLLSNAFKFTLAGEIAVHLAWRDDHVELSVRDTGAGISGSDLERIFDRFHRVEGTHGRSFEGTGIGLALVHELVALHGGTIRVSSVEGQGSTFAVAIPRSNGLAAAAPGVLAEAGETLATPTQRAAQWLPGSETPSWTAQARGDAGAQHPLAWPAPARAAAGDAPRSRILIADDNADMRAYLIHLLQSRWEVEAVGDGEAALAAARARPPDLVLSDVMMPRLDGLGLLRELRADPQTSTIPVVLLSARAGEEAVLSGLDTGADDYLVKPFSARELMARVRTQLEMARARRVAVEAAERERGQAMLRFLADASSALAESLDYATTLGRVAELAVPFLADWCFLDILEEDGSAQRVQVAHAGAAHASTVTQIKDLSVLMSDNPEHPPTRALRELRPVLIEDYDEARMRVIAYSEAHLPAMLAVGAGSLMSLPLVARGRALGVLTVVVSVSGRRYGAPDTTLAEELARRCALAMDNARLHRQLQDALHLRDDFLAIAAHELQDAGQRAAAPDRQRAARGRAAGRGPGAGVGGRAARQDAGAGRAHDDADRSPAGRLAHHVRPAGAPARAGRSVGHRVCGGRARARAARAAGDRVRGRGRHRRPVGPRPRGAARGRPGRKRGQVRRGPADRGDARAARRGRAAARDRPRHGHPARGPGAHLPALRARGVGAQVRRLRAGPVDHAPGGGGDGRDHRGRERARPGLDVHGRAAAEDDDDVETTPVRKKTTARSIFFGKIWRLLRLPYERKTRPQRARGRADSKGDGP